MAHWRYTQKPVRFFFLDFRASFLCLLLVMHCRLWTCGVCGMGLVLFWLLERKGLSVPMALSRLRHNLVVLIAGKRRPGCAFPKRQRFGEG